MAMLVNKPVPPVTVYKRRFVTILPGTSLEDILAAIDAGQITAEEAAEALSNLQKKRTTPVERFFNSLVA